MTGNTPGEHIEVTSWDDINNVTSRIGEKQKQLIKEHLNERLPDNHVVVWLPEFIRDKSIDPIVGDDQLYVCRVEDYSDDAWAATQDGIEETEFLPKSWSIIFERGTEFERIESEQTGLTGWAR